MADEQKPTERRFSVKSVFITRGYSSNSAFVANVSVENIYGNEIKVTLPDDRVLDLIKLVDDLIVDTLKEQFKGMAEDHLDAIEEQKKKALENKTVETTAKPA